MDKIIFTKDFIKQQNMSHIAYVGNYTYGHPNILFWDDRTKLNIGKFCSIARNVTFILGGNHRMDWITTYPFSMLSDDWKKIKEDQEFSTTNGNINIGNDVWIGNGVTILSGVTIGDGAIIGANSLVSKNIEPYTIVGGNPATLIRKRFSDTRITYLLKIKWWDWSKEKINENMYWLCSNNTNESSEKTCI